jgi:hypothetical protein
MIPTSGRELTSEHLCRLRELNSQHEAVRLSEGHQLDPGATLDIVGGVE